MNTFNLEKFDAWVESRNKEREVLLQKNVPKYSLTDPGVNKRIKTKRKVYKRSTKKNLTEKQVYYRDVYLKSEHWKELRLQKLRKNASCEHCNDAHRVEPHHKVYKNLYDVEITDLITLCRKCHREEHKRLDKLKKLGVEEFSS